MCLSCVNTNTLDIVHKWGIIINVHTKKCFNQWATVFTQSNPVHKLIVPVRRWNEVATEGSIREKSETASIGLVHDIIMIRDGWANSKPQKKWTPEWIICKQNLHQRQFSQSQTHADNKQRVYNLVRLQFNVNLISLILLNLPSRLSPCLGFLPSNLVLAVFRAIGSCCW